MLIALLVWGKTVNPAKQITSPVAKETPVAESLDFNTVLNSGKKKLSPQQNSTLNKLETALKSAASQSKIDVYKRLATFWKDTGMLYEPYLFYTAEAAKLENSEKSLTFAAQQFINSLLEVADPAIQNWLATNAKVLFDKALAINPNNDSSKIGLGACYILGNISNNPMEGILPVKEIATKTPDNLFAQLILGLGGKKSGQFDKAIERFLIISNKEPNNVVIVLQLAECYEIKRDKENAKVWYKKAMALVDNVEIKKEIEKRISELK